MITYDVIMTPSDDGSWVLKSAAVKELRHHKYKRCLVMAKWCETLFSYYLASCDRYGSEYVNKKAYHFYKWKHNWLALAEKFKPNKEAK